MHRLSAHHQGRAVRGEQDARLEGGLIFAEDITMPVIPKFVGERIKRREDPRLISGTATYVDDIKLVGMLSAVIMRSPYAHAKINSVDLSKAREAAGVACVLSGEDLKDK